MRLYSRRDKAAAQWSRLWCEYCIQRLARGGGVMREIIRQLERRREPESGLTAKRCNLNNVYCSDTRSRSLDSSQLVWIIEKCYETGEDTCSKSCLVVYYKPFTVRLSTWPSSSGTLWTLQTRKLFGFLLRHLRYIWFDIKKILFKLIFVVVIFILFFSVREDFGYRESLSCDLHKRR